MLSMSGTLGFDPLVVTLMRTLFLLLNIDLIADKHVIEVSITLLSDLLELDKQLWLAIEEALPTWYRLHISLRSIFRQAFLAFIDIEFCCLYYSHEMLLSRMSHLLEWLLL